MSKRVCVLEIWVDDWIWQVLFSSSENWEYVCSDSRLLQGWSQSSFLLPSQAVCLLFGVPSRKSIWCRSNSEPTRTKPGCAGETHLADKYVWRWVWERTGGEDVFTVRTSWMETRDFPWQLILSECICVYLWLSAVKGQDLHHSICLSVTIWERERQLWGEGESREWER